MLFLIFALIILVGMGATLVRAVSAARTSRLIRRNGAPVSGEVIRLDTRFRTYYGGYLVTPVVRYRIGGHQYEAPVANRSDPAEVGSGMELIVDPDRPYEPVAASRSTVGTALGVSIVGVLLGATLTWQALVRL